MSPTIRFMLNNCLKASPVATVKRPRVLHVVRSLETGGLERIVSEMTVARGVDATQIVCLVARGPLADRVESCSGEVHILSHSAAGKIVLANRLYRLVCRLRPDIIHCHNMFAHLYGSAAAFLAGSIPVILTKHGPFFPNGRVASAIHRALLKRTYTVAVSSEIRGLLAGWAPGISRDIIHIPNGVPFAPRVESRERNLFRSEIGWLRNEYVFLAVSRIVRQKGFDDLVTAFRKVRREQPNARLVIAGDGPLRSALEAQVKALSLLGPVQFLGQRMDVSRLYSAADAFVIPSEVEGTPMALLEAMAAGLPVVATSVGDMPRVVNNRETGLLVQPRSPVALADAMLSLMACLTSAAEMGRRARRRIESEYSIASTLEKYEALYDSVTLPRRIKTSLSLNSN